jgi:hypothetical protein
MALSGYVSIVSITVALGIGSHVLLFIEGSKSSVWGRGGGVTDVEILNKMYLSAILPTHEYGRDLII